MYSYKYGISNSFLSWHLNFPILRDFPTSVNKMIWIQRRERREREEEDFMLSVSPGGSSWGEAGGGLSKEGAGPGGRQVAGDRTACSPAGRPAVHCYRTPRRSSANWRSVWSCRCTYWRPARVLPPSPPAATRRGRWRRCPWRSSSCLGGRESPDSGPRLQYSNFRERDGLVLSVTTLVFCRFQLWEYF